MYIYMDINNISKYKYKYEYKYRYKYKYKLRLPTPPHLYRHASTTNNISFPKHETARRNVAKTWLCRSMFLFMYVIINIRLGYRRFAQIQHRFLLAYMRFGMQTDLCEFECVSCSRNGGRVGKECRVSITQNMIVFFTVFCSCLLLSTFVSAVDHSSRYKTIFYWFPWGSCS